MVGAAGAGSACKVESASDLLYDFTTHVTVKHEVPTTLMNANTRHFEAELEAQDLEIREAPEVSSDAEVVTATAL